MVHIRSAAIVTLLMLLLFSIVSRAEEVPVAVTVYHGKNTDVKMNLPVKSIAKSGVKEVIRSLKKTGKELKRFGKRSGKELKRFGKRVGRAVKRLGKKIRKIFGK
ncbi:hypothetical protein COOONC_09341 [Cooperia oncophora]